MMAADVRRLVARMIQPVANRVRLVASRAVVSLIDDTTGYQNAQAAPLADEVHDNVEHFQEYGFTSVPFDGAEGVYVSAGGVRSNGILICVGNRKFRLKGLQQGEVALYDDQGSVIKLGRNKQLTVASAGGQTLTLDGAGSAATLDANGGTLTVKGSAINIGGSASHPSVYGDQLNIQLNAILTILTSIVTLLNTAGGQMASTPIAGAMTAGATITGGLSAITASITSIISALPSILSPTVKGQ